MADVRLQSPPRDRLDRAAGDDEPSSDDEPPSFRQIYQDHAALAWRMLRRLGVRDAEAEDACQDVFVVVNAKLSGFDRTRPLKPWIIGICLKVAAGYRRKVHLRRETSAEAPHAAVEPAQPRAIESRQARAMLEHILSQLTDEQREVFVLFELQELPMSEVADLVAVPLQTAYSRLYAARRRVDAQIERLQAGGTEESHGS
jgi:RNA polymerase sigma-70 factor, ECF subfamily